MDPNLFGPSTSLLDRVHGAPIWTRSMDPLFFRPEKKKKKIIITITINEVSER